MKILLASNASYDPPKGGSTRSNLAWLRHMAASGHSTRVVCAAPHVGGEEHQREVDGITIRSVANPQRHAATLAQEIRLHKPDWVLVSSEDLSHMLLRAACDAAPGRVVYLAHTPQFFPFGPESWHNDASATALLRACAGVVTIGEHMAAYVREHLQRDAHVVHPPIYGTAPWPEFGRFGTGPVLMVNPCAVKGISILLALADRMPQVEFAALASWGTSANDRREMQARANVRVLEPVKEIDEVLSQARCLLMPSLWYEGFGLIAMEALLRGLPVIASDYGGLAESKRGTGYLIPIHPVERYEMIFDDTGMPRAVIGEQDVEPWVAALTRLLNDESEYWAESRRSRTAAQAFVEKLDAGDLARYLESLPPASDERTAAAAKLAKLTPAQRAMLLDRLRSKKDLG